MAGIRELLAMAEYDRQSNEASNPLFRLVGGIEKGMTDEYERKKQEEQTKTGFAKLQQILNGTEKDYQNKYKIKPTYDSKTGTVGGQIAEVSDADQFSSAVQSGASASDLYTRFPQYADKVDLLRMNGILPNGQSIPAAPPGRPIPTSIQPNQPPMSMVDDQELVPTEFDALGRPKGYKVNKPTVEEKKFEADMNLKTEKQSKTEQALKDSAQQTINTINEIKRGLKYFGAAGDIPAFPAEYDKKNWTANYNRLKDKLVVDLMLQLKSASPTGSTGFGQLSEKEGQRLENAATALQKGMKEEDAIRYLQEIESGAMKILGANDSGQPVSQGGIDPLEGKTATNPQTKQKIIRRGGQWVPYQQQ